MKIVTKYKQFLAGVLVGCLIVLGAALLWLSGGLTLKKHGEVVFSDFPKWIRTVTFENDLATVSVSDFTYDRDIPFELHFTATCKDKEYGSIIGAPYQKHFYFEYVNTMKGLVGSSPLNDVQGIHPRTKMSE